MIVRLPDEISLPDAALVRSVHRAVEARVRGFSRETHSSVADGPGQGTGVAGRAADGDVRVGAARPRVARPLRHPHRLGLGQVGYDCERARKRATSRY